MKKTSSFPSVYLTTITVLVYLPIFLVMIYSFNESKLSSVWTGFSWKWYTDLFRDRTVGSALINSIFLGVVSSLAAAVIGTLGAVGTFRTDFKGKGIMEYIATLPMMTPEIILGMLFLAFFSLIGLPFGMTTLIISHTAFSIPYIFMQVKARLSVFVTGVNVNTLPILIYTQLKTGITPKVNALCTLMFLATIILVLLSSLLGRLGNKKQV